MNVNEALKALKSLGSAQTRKTYSRHGVTGQRLVSSWVTFPSWCAASRWITRWR